MAEWGSDIETEGRNGETSRGSALAHLNKMAPGFSFAQAWVKDEFGFA